MGKNLINRKPKVFNIEAIKLLTTHSADIRKVIFFSTLPTLKPHYDVVYTSRKQKRITCSVVLLMSSLLIRYQDCRYNGDLN